MNNTTQNTVTCVDTTKKVASNAGKKSTGTAVSIIICAILGIAGVAFGVYGYLNSSQKNQQISDLETKLEDKNSEINELEIKISNLEAEIKDTVSKPVANQNSQTATIILGDKLDENEARTVFNIGDCTYDPPSIKCHVGVDGKQALISYITSDIFLRLTIPKE